ncbi:MULTISPECIES: hypothetical protein [Rhizobium/Agrobacterium group]|uniref:hypothetical protein n=1 Tax=Rhizobium/Agrobacterium group TaxID=227290 RepID=UPI00110F0164|nr:MULTISPECIES: hypothetical protein [Rhizobium/Agrobacterium group]NWJ26217.1 hypothetical protein [Rhizobium sp. RM]TMV20806.1 hypothetical protein BJG94_08935 [Rhizobium sp. Td3]UXS01409.1 hypothetical protein FY156_07910 [Agrobacterium tumefaciens]
MLKTALVIGLMSASALLAGCQTWESPYRGTQWRMDQVMDGDPYRVGDGNHQQNGTASNAIIRR